MAQRRPLRWAPLLLVALPCVGIGWFSMPSADDFTHALLIREAGGPLAYAFNSYATWSGRLLTELLTGLTLRSVDGVPILAVLHACALLSIGIALVAPAGRSWPLAAAVATAALWVSLRPVLDQTVYWATGGLNYVVPVALGLVWLAVGKRALNSNLQWPLARAGLWVVAGVVLGTAHEQASAALLAAGVTTLGMCTFQARRFDHRKALFGLGLAAFSIGTLALIVAPGNRLRAASVGQAPVLEPVLLFVNSGHVLQGMLVFLTLGFALGILAGLVLGLSGVANPQRWVSQGVPLLVGGFAAVLPLAPIPEFAADRTAFTPTVYLFGAALALTAAAASRFRPSRQLTIGLATALLMAFFGQSMPLVREASDYHAAEVARVTQLAEGSATSLTVGGLGVDKPDVLPGDGLNTDESSWVNVSVARYYALGSVRVAKQG
jgi:hypothetical protein